MDTISPSTTIPTAAIDPIVDKYFEFFLSSRLVEILAKKDRSTAKNNGVTDEKDNDEVDFAVSGKLLLDAASRGHITDVFMCLLYRNLQYHRQLSSSSTSSTNMKTKAANCTATSRAAISASTNTRMDDGCPPWAALSNNDILYKVIACRDIHGRTPLHLASGRNHKSVVRMLLDHGPQCISLEKDNKGMIPLHHAAYYSCASSLRLLLNHATTKEEINFTCNKGRTPLHFAAKYDNHEGYCVHALLTQHTSPALCVDVTLKDKKGRTAIRRAAEHGLTRPTKMLLEYIPTSTIKYHDNLGWTVLYWLSKQYGTDEYMKRLLITCSDGYNVNQSHGLLGLSPLHAAVIERSEVKVKLLLWHGAIPNVQSKDGKTPLDIAKEMNHRPIQKLLVDAMAAATNIGDN